MNKVTQQLKGMGTLNQSNPDSSISQEDMEDAQYFTSLARKNEAGTLTVQEADEILELFEGDNVLIIDRDGKRYVDYT